MTNKSATLTTAKPRDDKQIVQRFSEVISRVNCEKPKAADMTELKQMLSDHDDLKLWQGVVSIARLSEATLLGLTFIKQKGLIAVWEKRQAEMRRELGYDAAPHAERFLISHVALCWLRLMITEYQHTSHLTSEHSFKSGMYWDKRLTEAQKRYTRAVETLAKVRTLSAATRLLETRTAAASSPRVVNRARLLEAG